MFISGATSKENYTEEINIFLMKNINQIKPPSLGSTTGPSIVQSSTMVKSSPVHAL